MKVSILMVLLMCAIGAAKAQNSDLGVLVGVAGTPGGPRVGEQINYARQILERPIGRLYIELPAFVPANSQTVIFTPGIRFHHNLSNRVVIYASLGAGIALQPQIPRADAGYALGIGFDYRLTHRWSLREDTRGFVAGAPSSLLMSDRYSSMFGAALHF